MCGLSISIYWLLQVFTFIKSIESFNVDWRLPESVEVDEEAQTTLDAPDPVSLPSGFPPTVPSGFPPVVNQPAAVEQVAAPSFPVVPSTAAGGMSDFDDLQKRFEALKKK
jgi:hypothetical protein